MIGKNVGTEQSCSEGFERPVLVVRSFGESFLGIPITSSDSKKKKEKNPLYYKLEDTEYTSQSGEIKKLRGFAALHQLRLYDCRRLKRRVMKLDSELFEDILKTLTNLL